MNSYFSIDWERIEDCIPQSPERVLLGAFNTTTVSRLNIKSAYIIGELGGGKNCADIIIEQHGHKYSVRATHWCRLSPPHPVEILEAES